MTSDELAQCPKVAAPWFQRKGTRPSVHILRLQNHDSGCRHGRMRERKVDISHLHRFSAGGCAPVQHQFRLPRREPNYFDVAPATGRSHAGANGFEERFLGGKARGQRCGVICVPPAVGLFACCKKSLQRAFTAPVHEFSKARYINQVQTGTEHHAAIYVYVKPAR